MHAQFYTFIWARFRGRYRRFYFMELYRKPRIENVQFLDRKKNSWLKWECGVFSSWLKWECGVFSSWLKWECSVFSSWLKWEYDVFSSWLKWEYGVFSSWLKWECRVFSFWLKWECDVSLLSLEITTITSITIYLIQSKDCIFL